VPIGVVGEQRRGREDRERSGWVFDEDVPVGNPAVQERPCVLAVEAEVAVLPAAEEPALWNGGRNQVDRRYERSRPERNPGLPHWRPDVKFRRAG
jgi:hypothetical protein